jgi:hypothetical protein
MLFGLLPEFSTPVQKPVENTVLRRTETKNRSVCGRLLRDDAVLAPFLGLFRASRALNPMRRIG